MWPSNRHRLHLSTITPWNHHKNQLSGQPWWTWLSSIIISSSISKLCLKHNQHHHKCIIRTSMGESMVEDDSGEEESNEEELILPLDNNATLWTNNAMEWCHVDWSPCDWFIRRIMLWSESLGGNKNAQLYSELKAKQWSERSAKRNSPILLFRDGVCALHLGVLLKQRWNSFYAEENSIKCQLRLTFSSEGKVSLLTY